MSNTWVVYTIWALVIVLQQVRIHCLKRDLRWQRQAAGYWYERYMKMLVLLPGCKSSACKAVK